MLCVFCLLVVLCSVKCGSASTFKSSNGSHNSMQETGEEINIPSNITFAREDFTVLSLFATLLRRIKTPSITFKIKMKHHEEPLSPSNRSREIKPKFQTTLPVVKLGDKYYYVESSIKLNYFGALHFCKRNHMELLSIESKMEDQFIKNYLFNNFPTSDSFWISGTDLAKEGDFVWMSTGQPFSYTNWHPVDVKEPNNVNNAEHCVHMYQYFNSPNFFFWNDVHCGVPYNFICETEPISANT
ncbi:hypothetical protein WA026_021639 [Henosepilachna vigintioctopunctata]|uniref:C-type lectin domain-containing protein n=2 Tax=Henosepilachna vigintioctopunctata TaxID=420089 RepID=A0AAW1UB77_9CUCU